MTPLFTYLRLSILTAILTSLSPQAGAAAVFECEQASGEIVLRENGCRVGEETLTIRTTPPTSSKPSPASNPKGSVATGPNPNTTVGGYPACRSREWWDDLVSSQVQGDRDSFSAYIDSGRCVVLKSGAKVTITDYPGLFGGTVEFVVRGVKLWGPREGINF